MDVGHAGRTHVRTAAIGSCAETEAAETRGGSGRRTHVGRRSQSRRLQRCCGCEAALYNRTGPSMAITILITGFGPFPGAPFNPTEPLAQELARRRHPASPMCAASSMSSG